MWILKLDLWRTIAPKVCDGKVSTQRSKGFCKKSKLQRNNHIYIYILIMKFNFHPVMYTLRLTLMYSPVHYRGRDRCKAHPREHSRGRHRGEQQHQRLLSGWERVHLPVLPLRPEAPSWTRLQLDKNQRDPARQLIRPGFWSHPWDRTRWSIDGWLMIDFFKCLHCIWKTYQKIINIFHNR
jgi:hypothetical protein